MANGQILTEMSKQMEEIDAQLGKDSENIDTEQVRTELRLVLRSMRMLMSAFIEISGEDHKKINIMWPTFQATSWAVLIMLAAILANFATKFVTVSFINQ